MSHPPAPGLRLGLAGALLAGALCGTALVAVPAAAAPVPAGLSITLTDGVTQVRSDMDVTYTVKVGNAGGTKVTAKLVLTAPAYATLSRAAAAGTGKHIVTWKITVPAGKAITRTASAHIGTIARTDLRVTTLASLYQGKSSSGVPLIRTADANSIAGVTDPAHTVPPPGHPGRSLQQHTDSGPSLWLIVGLPIAAVLLLAAAAALWWRRRRGNSEPADEESEDASSGPDGGIDLVRVGDTNQADITS